MVYDVVIVGAGIMGCAAAYWLTKAGKRVVVLEKHEPGHASASSSDESRAIRYLYRGQDSYTQMVASAMRLWRTLERELGVRLFEPTGTLVLQSVPDHPPLTAGYEGLRRLGYAPRWLDATQLRRRYPQFQSVHSGVFHAAGGYLRARAAVLALAAKAREQGAEIRHGCEVVGFNEHGRTITAALTSDRTRVEGEAFIIAPGPWAAKLLPHLPISVRSTAARLHYLRPSQPGLYSAPRFPLWSVLDTQFYGFPVHWRGALKIADDAIGPAFDPDGDREAPDPAALAKMREFLRTHLPGLVDAPVTYAKTCTYAMTEDAHFIIDWLPGQENAVVAAGFSGHGFKFGILVGLMLSDLLIRGRSRVDISPFQLGRATTPVGEHW